MGPTEPQYLSDFGPTTLEEWSTYSDWLDERRTQLKEDINNFIFTRAHQDMTLKAANEMSENIFEMFEEYESFKEQ